MMGSIQPEEGSGDHYGAGRGAELCQEFDRDLLCEVQTHHRPHFLLCLKAAERSGGRGARHLLTLMISSSSTLQYVPLPYGGVALGYAL